MLGGAAGTAVFTGWMLAAQELGLLGELPPRKITRKALDAVTDAPKSKAAIDVATAVAHFGYGLGTGALFGLLFRSTRRLGAAPVQGALFGAAVWAASYMGWIPAVGIMPPPQRDRPDRPVVMFLGHLVFGGILGAVVGRRPVTARAVATRW